MIQDIFNFNPIYWQKLPGPTLGKRIWLTTMLRPVFVAALLLLGTENRIG